MTRYISMTDAEASAHRLAMRKSATIEVLLILAIAVAVSAAFAFAVGLPWNVPNA
jgi:hypothetical protein